MREPSKRLSLLAMATLCAGLGVFAFLHRIHDAMAAGLITGLSVNDSANAGDWSVRAGLAAGNTQYGDRTFQFTSVPASVAGSDWIRTANDSKAFTGATLA